MVNIQNLENFNNLPKIKELLIIFVKNESEQDYDISDDALLEELKLLHQQGNIEFLIEAEYLSNYFKNQPDGLV